MKANGTVNGYPAFRDDDGNISSGPHIECPHCGRARCFRPGEDNPDAPRGACTCAACGGDIAKPPEGECSEPAAHSVDKGETGYGAGHVPSESDNMPVCALCGAMWGSPTGCAPCVGKARR